MYVRPFLETVKLIDIYAQEWLHMNNRDRAKPRELTPYLITQGVFTHDNREGRPLRDVLRELDKMGRLDLIRGLSAICRIRNRSWVFYAS